MLTLYSLPVLLPTGRELGRFQIGFVIVEGPMLLAALDLDWSFFKSLAVLPRSEVESWY